MLKLNMRKLITLALAVIATVPLLNAQRPILVGHRGSDIGLENSVQSFRTGGERGYEYIETDFKVTKDKQFVCSHDDDLTRLGGTRTIATSTLEELQAEPLKQTRSGVQYTGRLCSAQEYLDVCKETGALPLIELKWATGINSNDCSNIPLLIKFIEDNGFRDKCIILTSMRPCLEYIRTNYPDIKLQFLTGEYWANWYDWCVQWNLDVDIQSGYFDEACVKKFHDAGLKVNVWTANTSATYKKYAEMPCDFITTDSLDPNDLPEIIILPDEEPDNEVAQPATVALERKWIMSNTTGNHPGNIDGTNAQQGTAVDGLFYINNCVDKKIYVFNSEGLVGSLEGGAGWGCARDSYGNIVVRNDKLTGNSHSFIVYSRGACPGTDNTTPAATFTAEVPAAGQTNFISATGNLLGAEGGHIFLYPNKSEKVNILPVKEGAPGEAYLSYDVNYTGTTAGYVSPINDSPNRWLYQIRTTGIVEYNNGHNHDVSVSRPATTAPSRNSTGGGAIFYLKGNKLLAHNSGANYKGGFTLRNLSTDEVIASVDPIGSLGYEAGGNYSTFNWLIPEKAANDEYLLYQYCPSNGIACYRVYDASQDGVADIVAGNTHRISVADGTVTIDGDGVEKVELISTAGTTVIATTHSSFSVSHLAKGVYIVRINGRTAGKLVK